MFSSVSKSASKWTQEQKVAGYLACQLVILGRLQKTDWHPWFYKHVRGGNLEGHPEQSFSQMCTAIMRACAVYRENSTYDSEVIKALRRFKCDPALDWEQQNHADVLVELRAYMGIPAPASPAASPAPAV